MFVCRWAYVNEEDKRRNKMEKLGNMNEGSDMTCLIL